MHRQWYFHSVLNAAPSTTKNGDTSGTDVKEHIDTSPAQMDKSVGKVVCNESYQLERLRKEKEKITVNHDLDGPCLEQQRISKAQLHKYVYYLRPLKKLVPPSRHEKISNYLFAINFSLLLLQILLC